MEHEHGRGVEMTVLDIKIISSKSFIHIDNGQLDSER